MITNDSKQSVRTHRESLHLCLVWFGFEDRKQNQMFHVDLDVGVCVGPRTALCSLCFPLAPGSEYIGPNRQTEPFCDWPDV